MKNHLLLHCVTLFCALSIFAQQLPPVELSSLERPEPIVVLSEGDPATLLQTAAAFFKSNGFQVEVVNARAGNLEVRKSLPGPTEGYDRVILWMDRDIAERNSVRIFLLFARYIKVFGRDKMGRLLLNGVEESKMTEPWRSNLLEKLSTSKAR